MEELDSDVVSDPKDFFYNENAHYFEVQLFNEVHLQEPLDECDATRYAYICQVCFIYQAKVFIKIYGFVHIDLEGQLVQCTVKHVDGFDRS